MEWIAYFVFLRDFLSRASNRLGLRCLGVGVADPLLRREDLREGGMLKTIRRRWWW
jgi:hypothetical protein